MNLKAEFLSQKNIKAPMNKNNFLKTKYFFLIDKNKSNVNIAGLNILKTTQMP